MILALNKQWISVVHFHSLACLFSIMYQPISSSITTNAYSTLFKQFLIQGLIAAQQIFSQEISDIPL